MKNALKITFILFLTILYSCSQENDILDELNVNETLILSESNQDVVQKIIDLGYDISVIQELDDYFLVGGDILFSKDLSDYADLQVNGRHASSNNLVNLTRLNITVRVDGSIPSSGNDNWRTAVQSAVNDWNSINNCGVFMVYTTSNFADITVRSDGGQLPNGTIASAGFPSNRNPFNTVLINLDFFNNRNVSESGKRYNMVHELGHAIGFRHTNWDIRGEGVGPYGANLIPGTPNQDAASVMNGGTALSTWSGFSNFDQVAARFLYPFAVRLEYETVFEEFSQDGIYVEEDVYLNIFRDASNTSRLNLPTTRTANYTVEERVTNIRPSGVARRNFNATLLAGRNRFFLRTVETEDCQFDFGNPVGVCYQRDVIFNSVN